ncbi:type IV secretion system protein [Bordetella genomosp. 11]|uniref:Conjugal transfer protein TraH n=1 Tax=Bordetella genomosp. 11 TaxID=1416808 RepID=A0A261UKP6_9BORD|nr:type IV secretion system protein [Bordetella genomosp. 11]OZI62107.1 hypothetical protein CAL28_23055 [Bordetella genomosp. 11]
MAIGAVQLTSLGSIARWMDASVTSMLEQVVTPMVSSVTAALLPFVTVCLSISLVWYGWLIATGAIPIPAMTALRKVVEIAVIVSIAGAGGLYQTRIVSTMLDLPSAMTSVFTSEPSTPSQLLDDAANNGAEISTKINDRAPSFFSDAAKAFAFVLVSVVITVISALLSAVGIIVLVSVKAGMGLLVVVGPLCILALLFDFTKEFFKKWLSQALYFALYSALFMVIFSLIMSMFAMLQQGLLATTDTAEINIFSMLTAITIFIAGAAFMLSQVSVITRQLTGGAGTGVPIPFVGRIG